MRYVSHVLGEGVVQLSDSVRIRKEYFGGIAFHTNTGDTLEIDHEACKFLVWLRETGSVDIKSLLRHEGVRTILPTLLDLDIIEHLPEQTSDVSGYSFPASINDMPTGSNCQSKQILSAPETVHLAVTYQCGELCPDCYSRKNILITGKELDTAGMRGVVDILADSGVFQLAIGGGEPFARIDLYDITAHAASSGLAVHVTTGQYVPSPQWDDVLKHIKSLHIGIRSEELMNNAVSVTSKLRIAAEYVSRANVYVGANLIITKFTIKNRVKLAELLIECGFKRLIFLRYKPIADHDRWNSENPGGEDLDIFRSWLTQAKRQYPHVMLRVDCAAAFLMRHLDPQTAIRAGINGCTAGQRIISIAPDGCVYPCSQLVGHGYYAGDLKYDSFKTIWCDSDVLSKYRFFRQNTLFATSVCGGCASNSFCGGCRIFANDNTGSEPFCPMWQIKSATYGKY